MPRTLGFFHRGRHSPGRYGVGEAEEGLLAAIVKYSSWDKIILWTDHSEVPIISEPRAEVRPVESLNRDLEGGCVDVIHHVGLGPSSFARARRSRPVPVFTSVFPALSYNHQLQAHVIESLVRKTDQDTTIFPSRCSMEAVMRIRRQLIESGLEPNGYLRDAVIPIGVDSDRFTPCTPAQRRDIRERQGIPRNATVALVVSRFSPADKADLLPLLRSMKYPRTVAAGELVLLLAGGDGYYGAKAYIELLEQEVAALGLQDQVMVRTVNDRSYIIDLVKGSDIFLSPADSVQETFGITPLEAMSAGLPAIVSDWNGYRETVVHGSTGYLAKTTIFNNESLWNRVEHYADFRYQHLMLGQSVCVDTDTMVGKCYELAERPETLSQMSAAARAHVLENYAWATVIARYEELWLRNQGNAGCFLTEREFPCALDYFSVFQDYATEIHQDAWLFQPTRFGLDLCHGKLPLRVLSDLAHSLPADRIRCVLQALLESPASVSDLVLRTGDSDKDAIRFCVAWMAKNRVIQAIERNESTQ